MASTSAESASTGVVTLEAGGGGFDDLTGGSEVSSPPPDSNPSPYWRFILADMATGAPISILDRKVRDRSIEYERNTSTTISGTVSSDDPAVNEIDLSVDGFPKLAEGDRLLYCLRRDYGAADFDHVDRAGGIDGPWYPRASGILLQYDDAGATEDANTTFTAFDPWTYLYTLPVIAPLSSAPLLHNSDLRYDRPLDEIVIALLENAEEWYNGGIFSAPEITTWGPTSGPRKCFIDWGWSAFYQGQIDPVPPPLNSLDETVPTFFQKGTSIGQAFDQLITIGDFDIVLTPIYDPVNRPGILCELSVIFQEPFQTSSTFAWDYSPWSVSEVSRLVDGGGRRNRINLHATQGGDTAGILSEFASVNRFGEYWDERWLIDQEHTAAVAVIAQTLLDTISEHPRSVEISPLPERSPEPFIDWYLGNEVEVLASNNLRATMSGFQRVQAFTLEISDDALERVTGLRVFIPGTSPSQ